MIKIKPLKLFLPLLVVFLAVPAFAQQRIVDNAGLLSAGERENLLGLIASISSRYNFDLVIVTARNIGNTRPADYADDFFDNNGYGLGPAKDGCLFLQVTDSRDIWFSTSGRGIGIFNLTAENKLSADMVKHLGENNPYQAYRSFLLNWEEFLALDAKGRSYNFIHQWNNVIVFIAWALALAIGFIIVHSWKMSMNTALSQNQAAAYTVPGSLTFRANKDSFLYSTVAKTRRQEQAASSGGNIRMGSSGNRHGGGGRKY